MIRVGDMGASIGTTKGQWPKAQCFKRHFFTLQGFTRQGVSCVMLAWLALMVTLGCGGGDDVIIKTSDGVELTAEDIDRNPLALMPGGAVGVFNIDAPSLFQSSAGARLLTVAQSRLPLPLSAGFAPERDLERIVLGLYSFQGVDFMGVATGKFDPEAIEKAASASETTPLGTPLVRVEYAGRVFYVSANIGFVVLTNRTVVFGNETGIRRALDRMEAGRIGVEMPEEMASLMERPGAPIAFASDARHDPQVAALASQFAFLKNVGMVRAVGNFDAPGMNLAGTLTYVDEAAALEGQASIQQLRQGLATVGFLTSILGMSQPIQNLQADVNGSSLQVTIAFDAQAAASLLDTFASSVGATGNSQAQPSSAGFAP